jgi:hypothetical protein
MTQIRDAQGETSAFHPKAAVGLELFETTAYEPIADIPDPLKKSIIERKECLFEAHVIFPTILGWNTHRKAKPAQKAGTGRMVHP